MTYAHEDIAEAKDSGLRLSAAQTAKLLHAHGNSIDELIADVGTHEHYHIAIVLDWLGY